MVELNVEGKITAYFPEVLELLADEVIVMNIGGARFTLSLEEANQIGLTLCALAEQATRDKEETTP